MESFTLTGQMLGSPNFMPPEQASSQRGKVGRHSDVYGVGAILYHLLTARPPFQAESFESVLNQVLYTEPVSPRLLNSSVPADLETICVKCLQKEPSRRYQSAQELADELDRFLRDKPIHARAITRAERTWRWCRRNPVVAWLGLALVLAITVGFAGVLVELRRVKDGESNLRRNLYTSNMNLAHLAWEEGNLQRAQKLLLGHVPQAGKEDLRGFEWRYLWKLCQDESHFTFTNVHFVGDRHGLAQAADRQTVIAASGDTLKWLNGQKQREVQTITVGPKAITRLSMAIDQPGLVAYRTDRVNALSPTEEALLGSGLPPDLGGGPDPILDGAFALSWDGALLAASGTNSTVRIFIVKTREQLGPEFSLGKNEDIYSLAFSPDARYLACGTAGTKIHILEAPSLKRVNELKAHTSIVGCLAFDRAGKKLVSSADSHIRVWSFPDCGLAADLPGQQGMVGDLAFSPDGLRLASGGTDHTVRLWNLANPGAPILLRLLHGHRGAVTSVLFSSDGNQLYTGSDDGTVKVWEVSAQESTNILRVSGWSDNVAFSPDGSLVAVTDYCARTAVLWQLPSQRWVGNVGEHTGPCQGAKFSTDGKLLATAGPEVQVWEISTKKIKFTFPSGSLAFHPVKPLLVIVGKDLRFWDLQNGAQMNLPVDAPAKGVETAVFSPNGKSIALGMKDGQVTIWDFVTGHRLCFFHEHSAAINALCFSHDGILLASGGEDKRVVLYDMRKGVPMRLEGHFDRVFGLAFAPDDKSLVSTSWDGTIRFWSLANHQVALTLAHDGGPVNSVAFLPDGNLMATAGSDGTARLWPAATFKEIAAREKAKVNGK
jgi:WD40 repeat protein